VARPNFGFQKRQKEIAKQEKKAAKAEKKRLRNEAPSEGESAGGGQGEEGEEDDDEDDDTQDPSSLELRARLQRLCEEGWDLWDRFDTGVRAHTFHPFVAADYPMVLQALIPLQAPGLRFLEWGSATGVITIMADLLGFEAWGIEIDGSLVEQARELAHRNGSGARFVQGSFIPTGYRWRAPSGDHRTGTIEEGESGYLKMGRPVEDFDVVFGYPWPGEEPLMLELMRVHGRRDAIFLLHSPDGVRVYRGGRLAA